LFERTSTGEFETLAGVSLVSIGDKPTKTGEV
jgi:hypothetical protein